MIRFLHFLDIQTDGGPETNKTLVWIKRGIEMAAEEAGFRPIYNLLSPQDDLVFAPEDGETVGVLLLGPPSKEAAKKLMKLPCCWVMTGCFSPEWGDQVMPDHREVGQLAARYLVSKKHKHIAFLQFGPRQRVHRFWLEGFGHEMEKYPDVKWSIVSNGDTPEGIRSFHFDKMTDQLISNLKKCKPLPTGVFIDQDQTLFTLYPKLVKAGLTPGKNLDVIICDNIHAYRQELPFEYKSIDVHFELVGRMAVGQLLWRIKNPQFAPQIRSLVQPELE